MSLSRDITVLVGENASGKSAIIDGIRLVTTSALERGGLPYSPEFDPTFNTGIAPVEISARYTDLTEEQKAFFMTELVDEHEDLIYRSTLTRDSDTPYWKANKYTVGEGRLEDPEPINRKRIAHVYLPPLRDAVLELDSGGGERLAEVLKVLTASDKPARQDFVDEANKRLKSIAELKLAESAQGEIKKHFEGITPPTRRHDVRLGGREQELRRLAGLLRMQLADSQIDPLRLASSGLGYANMLYIATIIVQLVNAKDYDLTILLVEEPEAHLHPQLQSVLLDYLRRQAQESRKNLPAGSLAPAGQVQIIVSTHSPNLSSAVSVEEIAIVSRVAIDRKPATLDDTERVDDADTSGEQAAAEESPDPPWRTKVTSLKDLGLSPASVRKLNRYLTVTRSSLLFARHVVLVEGIAEAILIPTFVSKLLYPGNETARRHFASCSFVSIDGVDFEPYLSLLLLGEHSRVDKVVVITDADITKTGVSQGAQRKARIEKNFKDDIASGRLSIYMGRRTFEADLFAEAENEATLRSAYIEMHPDSGDKWDGLFQDVGADPEKRAELFSKEIKTKTGHLDLGKGDFAQLVAESLEENESSSDAAIIVPTYIADAIRFMACEVVEGEESASVRSGS